MNPKEDLSHSKWIKLVRATKCKLFVIYYEGKQRPKPSKKVTISEIGRLKKEGIKIQKVCAWFNGWTHVVDLREID